MRTPRGALAQRHHEIGQEAAFADVAHVDAEGLVRGRRVELRRLAQGLLQRHQGTAHGRRQALGARRGLHAGTGAHEERVLEQQAQARQALAHGGLGQVQQLGRTPHLAHAVDGVEHAQQVEIEVLDIHISNN